jgi:hypothetical protein
MAWRDTDTDKLLIQELTARDVADPATQPPRPDPNRTPTIAPSDKPPQTAAHTTRSPLRPCPTMQVPNPQSPTPSRRRGWRTNN